MRRLPAAAAALVLGFSAPAWAEQATTQGGCFLAAVSEGTQLVSGPAVHTGVLGAAVVAVAPTAGNNPVLIEATCTLWVDRVPVQAGTVTGDGVAAFAVPVQFWAAPDAAVKLCTTVVTTVSGAVTSWSSCRDATQATVPPDAPLDAMCDLPPSEFVCAALYANRARTLTVLPEPRPL